MTKPITSFLYLAAGLAACEATAAPPPQLYADRCATCHAAGTAGAPRAGDKVEWGQRISSGMTLLYRSALEGMPNTVMMAKGGHADLSDGDVKAIVDLMVAAAGLPADALAAAARYDALGISNRDFIRLDTDRDGFLSRSEVAADDDLARALPRFDENADARLSEAEYVRLEAALERDRAAVTVGDATLVAQVRAALAKIKGISPGGIKVEAAGGAVTMAGVVDNAESARQAYALVRRIKGIKTIDNRLVSGDLLTFD